MKYEWILDVLSDLRAFAKDNGLANLAEQLDDTCLLAATEIAQQADKAPVRRAGMNGKTAGAVHRGIGASDNA